MTRSKRGILIAAALVVSAALVVVGWMRLGARSDAGAPPQLTARDAADSLDVDTALPDAAPAPRRQPDDARLAAALPLRPKLDGLVTGIVRLEGGDGVPDVPVHLSLHQGLARRDLGVARTDASGRYALELDLAAEVQALRAAREAELARIERALDGEELDPALLEELERRRRAAGARVLEPLGVRARVTSPGFAPARASMPLDPEPAERVRLDLVLARGAGVRGTVFHRNAPLADARVHLFDDGWRLHASATTDELGEYVLPLPEPGRFRLHARRDGVGASGTSGYSLGEALPYLSIDLDVDGLAVLYGRVRLFDGTPLVGLRLEALNAALFAEELAGGPALAFAQLARAEEPGGLRACAARSDEHGRVVFAGLHDGEFTLRPTAPVAPGVEPFGPFATGGQEHELVIDGHVLVVEVTPARGAGRRAHFDAPFIELVCLPRGERGGAGHRPPVRAVVPALDPVATFVVEPETTWRVLARTLEHTGVGEVRVPAGRHLTRLALELGAWDERVAREMDLASDDVAGGLEVVVTDEHGVPLTALNATLWPSGERGRPWLDAFPFGPDAPLPELPPGSYELAVEVLGAQAEWTVPLAVRSDVVIASGERTRVELRAQRGGRLRVRLHEVFVPRGFAPSSAVAVVLRDARTGAILERPEFALTEGALERVDVLYPGELGIGAPIAPGRYSVTFESTWFKPPSAWVELRAGTWSELEPVLVSPRVDEGDLAVDPIVGGDGPK